jgi:cation diffusion facilitator CzcD-associated flavoprotein CzcO
MKTIEADYLVVGAGAMGMAFVDTLITETDTTVVLVDRNDQPGGHWINA